MEIDKDILYSILQRRAFDLTEDQKATRDKLQSTNLKRELFLRYLKKIDLDFSDEDLPVEIHWFMEDMRPPEQSEIAKLVNSAYKYITEEYKKGKKGREMSSLFHRLFELIGEEALEEFNKP